MEKFNVCDEKRNEYFEVNVDYLDNIPTKNIEKLRLFDGAERLEVQYTNGKLVWYKNIFGSWGEPTTIK